MPQKICLVDTCFHLDSIPRVSLYGETSIKNYDIVVIDWRQCFKGWLEHDKNLDRPKIPTNRTKKYWDIIRSRNDDIARLAEKGATVFCITEPVEEYIDSNRIKVTSLDWLPRKLFDSGRITPASNCMLHPVRDNPLEALITEFQSDMECHAALEPDTGFTFITASGTKGVAGLVTPMGAGQLVFIPGFRKEIENRLCVSIYTEDEQDMVRRFVNALESASAKLGKTEISETPVWVETIVLPSEKATLDAIRSREKDIERIEAEIRDLKSRLNGNKSWRQLLYEKDENLGEIVRKSLELIGFQPEKTSSGENGIGGLFKAPEGYLLVNIEGTDNTAIDKKNLLKLFEQTAEEVSRRDEYVSSVLIGNAFRFKPPEARERQFSKPVEKIAIRHNLGLITSSELYGAIGYSLSHPDDEDFKSTVRKTLIENHGQEIRIDIPRV